MSTTLSDIDTLTRAYADARRVLAERVTDLEDQVRALKRRRLPGIRSALSHAAEAHNRLRVEVEAAPDLFRQPRTHVFHGVKVGYQKGKGEIRYTNERRVLERIRELLPDQAEVLIRIKETPAKAALLSLPAEDLKRLGCTVTGTGDQVVIRPADSAIDKLVDALLKDAQDQEDSSDADAA